MLTDAHNHLHWLSKSDLGSYGVDRCVTCGTSHDDWNTVLALPRSQPQVTAAVGVHPWFIEDTPHRELLKLDEILELHPGVAVGEVGLDKTQAAPAIERQREILRFHLDLAQRHARPIILHCVRAYGTLVEELEDSNLTTPAVLHDYRGSKEMIPYFSALPFPVYFSISRPELLPHIPPDRLLVESDASPDNGRTPAHVVEFHDEHAIDPEQTTENYLRVFPDQ